MAGIAQKITWGLLGAATTKATKSATRRALHRDGRPRLPRRARLGNGLGTALMWAGATGIVLALSDVFKEQRHDVAERSLKTGRSTPDRNVTG
jgi:hypothetical protein